MVWSFAEAVAGVYLVALGLTVALARVPHWLAGSSWARDVVTGEPTMAARTSAAASSALGAGFLAQASGVLGPPPLHLTMTLAALAFFGWAIALSRRADRLRTAPQG
jgi:hypothetical protein